MVNRLVVKCEVCEAVTLIRLQLGQIEQHPLRICCGRCKILITARIDVAHPDKKQKAVFDNARLIESASIDYCIQASPEFVTEKLQPMPAQESADSFSPYLAAFQPMRPEGYKAFIRTTTQFLDLAKNDWPKVRRINELWLSRQLPLLAKEMATLFPSERYPIDNELRGLMVVYRLNLLLHQPILFASRFRAASKLIFSAQESFSPEQRNELAEFGRQWVRRGIFQRLEERLLGLTSQLVERFQYLIPAFGLRFYSELPPELLVRKGMTTASFEDLKQFFVDAYELAGDLLPLVAVWNNIHHRGRWSQMAPGRADVQTPGDFERKAKGARFRFINGKENFDQLIYDRADIALRNAIAHGTYRYEGVVQSIEFYPGGHEDDPTDKRTTYLLEFASKCLDLYQSVRDLAFLMYQTHRWVLAMDGQEPLPMSDDEKALVEQRAPMKVGRNDRCPCGSGKKYKRCHGS